MTDKAYLREIGYGLISDLNLPYMHDMLLTLTFDDLLEVHDEIWGETRALRDIGKIYGILMTLTEDTSFSEDAATNFTEFCEALLRGDGKEE